MLGKAMIDKMYAYTCGVNGRILDHAAKLNEEQLAEPTEYGRGSLFDILFHTMSTEFVWRTLCQEQEIKQEQMPQRAAIDTFAQLQARWEVEQQAMNTYLSKLSDDDLAARVTIKRWDGAEYDMTIWHMLVHTMMHSMQHRSEAAAILTSYGQSPGDLDFIYSVM